MRPRVLCLPRGAQWWVYLALQILVTACPCALVLSTPVTMVAALAAAAKQGVLVKGGAVLEALAAARVVTLDKTGTLTEGRCSVRRGRCALEAPHAAEPGQRVQPAGSMQRVFAAALLQS